MAETEVRVVTDIVDKLDKSDESTARPSASFGPMHSSSETVDSIHASSATQPLDGGTLHGGNGTAPLGAGWELPDDPEAFARARAEVKATQGATALSLRQFATGYLEPSGTVAGLSKPTDSERNQG